jgi:hypothetical protein
MVTTIPRFIMYQAEARLAGFDSIFIDDNETLEARFGARVPVLRDNTKSVELDWPFDAVVVAALQAQVLSTECCQSAVWTGGCAVLAFNP